MYVTPPYVVAEIGVKQSIFGVERDLVRRILGDDRRLRFFGSDALDHNAVVFPFSDVQSARLVLTDRLLAATRPLDTSGADEEIEDEDTDGGAQALAEQED